MKKLISSCIAALLLNSCAVLTPLGLNSNCRESRVIGDIEPGHIALIEVGFDISLAGELMQFRETAECEYQGWFCPGGDLREVWYGDQSITHSLQISDSEVLDFWPHSFCIYLDEFKKECQNADCDAAEFFEFRLNLSDERTAQRQSECDTRAGEPTNSVDDFVKCAVPNVDSVTFQDLRAYGYEVQNQFIEIRDSGL